MGAEIVLEPFFILFGFCPHLPVRNLKQQHTVAVFVEQVAVVSIIDRQILTFCLCHCIIKRKVYTLLKLGGLTLGSAGQRGADFRHDL